MTPRKSIRAFIGGRLLGALLFSSAAIADPGAPTSDAEVRVQRDNYCLGGLEDRKIIVDENRITNPFRQTSLLGCEVDGGVPQTMPDLPAPSPDHKVLA